MKLPLEKLWIIVHLDKAEHVKNVLEESPWFCSFGTGIEILGSKKNDPDKLSIDECQSEGEHKKNQLIRLKPEHLHWL